MENRSKLLTSRNVLILILILGAVAPLNLLFHEIGHCITMHLIGRGCEGIYSMPDPGYKVWPLDELGQPYAEPWMNVIGVTRYEKTPPTQVGIGLVSLMGSGTVAILSTLALIWLFIFRPDGWVRFPLLAQSLMFLDLLLYTILPRWFGLRHFFFIGGYTPEPLLAAIKLGISEPVFIAGVLLYSFLMIAGFVWYFRQGVKKHSA